MTSWILNDTPSKVFPLYSRANVGEVFPDPISPLNATTGFLANLEPGWRDAYVACQIWDHDIYDDAVEHNLEELVPRVPGLELAGPVRRVRSSFLNGIKELPLQVAASSSWP